MAILNPDGSEYQLDGSLQQFDNTNPEHELFNTWDEELIEISGSPIEYYQVFIDVSNIDQLYLEAKNKIWSQFPVVLNAFYEPIAAQNFMNVFGADSPDEMMFELNYKATLRKLNHVPKIGSRIFTPHKREHWVIIQRNVQNFQMWGEIRLQLMCQRFQESLTTGEGKVTSKTRTPDFQLNSIKDLGSPPSFAGQ